MKVWKEKLYGFTGIFTLFSLWTPMLWFISSRREFYHMNMFEVFRMNWFDIFLFLTLSLSTLIAQLGLVLLSQDLTEFEKLKSENRRGYPDS